MPPTPATQAAPLTFSHFNDDGMAVFVGTPEVWHRIPAPPADLVGEAA